MSYPSQSFQHEKTKILFEIKEPDDLLFQEPIFEGFSVIVTIVNKDGEFTRYRRDFDKKISAAHYDRFVKKFLRDQEYRQQYLLSGFTPWKGTIDENREDVHEDCRKQIERINQKKNLKFKDFKNLKTCGLDKYSRLSLEKLEKELGQEQIAAIKSEFAENREILAAMRWCARGLKVQHAIRKVKTDREIENNAKNAR